MDCPDALHENSLFSYSGTELNALADARNYYSWILSYFAPWLGRTVLEVGPGIGTFSQCLLDNTDISQLILAEPAKNLFSLLQQRFSGNPRVTVVHSYLEELGAVCAAVDTVVLINVLEHIENDKVFLDVAHRLLVPGGAMLLFVPALPWLYGSLDKAFDHYRRYTKPCLTVKLKKPGFQLACLRYVNFPGVVTWYFAGKVLRRKTLLPRDIRLYDRWLVPWISKLEQRWEPPIGQSLIAIATKAK